MYHINNKNASVERNAIKKLFATFRMANCCFLYLLIREKNICIA